MFHQSFQGWTDRQRLGREPWESDDKDWDARHPEEVKKKYDKWWRDAYVRAYVRDPLLWIILGTIAFAITMGLILIGTFALKVI